MSDMNNIKIIRFNDDNHAERIWANGKYLGNLSDIEFIFRNFLDVCNSDKFEDVTSISIYVCDDFCDYDEDDELIDDIWEWFNRVEQMTEEQIKLVERRKWEELQKTIW